MYNTIYQKEYAAKNRVVKSKMLKTMTGPQNFNGEKNVALATQRFQGQPFSKF